MLKSHKGCICNLAIVNRLKSTCTKEGYIEFARIESAADAIHSAIVSPAVAMAAEVHCQRPLAGAQWLHICTMPTVE